MPIEAITAVQELVMFLVFGIMVVGVSFSPIARAVGNRIMHGKMPKPGTPADSARVEDLSEEMVALSRQMDEMQDRLDFAERMLTQAKERGLLGPGAGVGGKA